MGHDLCRNSTINIHCCGPFIRLALGGGIQGLSFDAWCSVKLCELKVVNLCFWWWSKNTYIFYWTRWTRWKQGLDKVFKMIFDPLKLWNGNKADIKSHFDVQFLSQCFVNLICMGFDKRCCYLAISKKKKKCYVKEKKINGCNRELKPASQHTTPYPYHWTNGAN